MRHVTDCISADQIQELPAGTIGNEIMKATKNEILVWDPIVRVGHWTLVVAFFTAYLSAEASLSVHVWAGYTVGVVVSVRFIWGIVGSKYARFSNFVSSPLATLRYIRELVTLRPQHYLGHNPAAGAMIVVLLISLSATVYSGLELYAVEENAGPLAADVAPAQAHFSLLISHARASTKVGNDENEHDRDNASESAEERGEFWQDIHEFFADLTVVLVSLHVIGVLFSSFVEKENLVKAMFTGRKQRGINSGGQ